MGKYLDELVEKGWLEGRRNPWIPMDKTYQYRVNLLKIQRDLLALGYFLEGYKVTLPPLSTSPESKNENSKSNYWTCDRKLDSNTRNHYREYFKPPPPTPQTEKTVVVVETEISELQECADRFFEVKLTKKQVKRFIRICQKEKVNTFKAISNTYNQRIIIGEPVDKKKPRFDGVFTCSLLYT